MPSASRPYRPPLVLANKLNAVRIREGRIDEAEAEYRNLLTRNPSNPEALNNLAWMLAMQGGKRTEEALTQGASHCRLKTEPQ